MKSDDLDFVNVSIIGKRGKEFKEFISSLLKRTNLSKKYIQELLKEEHIKLFQQAFTHKVIHPVENYEFFEILGDVTWNKAIVWYLKERFPFLNNSDGVKVIARLKINLVSRESFSKWAEELGFEKFISYDLETKMKHNSAVMEDCLEAFIGVTEYLIDLLFQKCGYYFCFQFVKSLLDEKKISLLYEDLYDPITRLKETFDFYTSIHLKNSCPYIWGTMKFESKKKEEGGHVVKLIQKGSGKEITLLTDEGNFLTEIKHKLCFNYLDFLKSKGYSKPVPVYYKEIETCRQQLEM